MNKLRYARSICAKNFYNGTELLAKLILHRRPLEHIERVRGIKYGDGPREKMNLLYTKDRSVKQPLMIYIHGGGWISGDTNMRDTYCMEFVKEGFFVANIDYAYAPRQIFPYQFQQCLNAIEKIMDSADRYNYDASNILLSGESAGGYFIAYLAAMSVNHELYDKLNLKFKYKDTFKVGAIISHCGAFDLERCMRTSKFLDIRFMLECFTGMTRKQMLLEENKEKVALISPVITKDFPPTMLIYASKDLLRYESLELKKQFDELGVPYDEFKGTGILSQHAFTIATCVKKGRTCLAKTVNFIKPYFKPYF